MNGFSTYSSSQFTITFRHSGISETFTAPANQTNKIAQLTSLSDRNGNTINYYYNASGQLDHLVDSHGQTTSFIYSSAGYVSQITDPSGRTYKYTQNASGQLTSYTDPSDHWDHYTYDGYGNLVEIETTQGNIIKIAYDAGNTNQVTSVTRYVHPADTSGPQTTYQFATASGTCPPNAGWIQGTVDDPDQHVSTYCTDDMSRIRQTVDANGHSRSTGYTPDGYISSLTSAQQTPTTFQYSSDGNDNVTQIQQGTGSSQVTVGLTYTDAAPNQYLPTTLTDPQGNQINYGYDSNGNLTSETDQLTSQNQATQSYNTDGTVKTSTDADGNTTTYQYTNGNLTEVLPPSGSGLNNISLFYDPANRVSEISSVANGAGHEVDYSYDPLDRITQAVYKNAAGSTVATISYTYDADGNLLSRTDSAGTSSYTYDGLNRELSESVPRGSGYDTTDYTYDPAGNITALSDAGGSVTYHYDKANQMTAVYDPGQSKPAATLTYDADGNLLRTVYQSGASVVRTYDGNDRLTSITDTYKTSSGQPAHLSYSYGYSGDLRSSLTDQAGNQTTYSYDKLNRLTEANTTGPNASDYKYTPDGAGNITSIYANGTTTSYTYNPGNEISTGGGHTYSYDADGNLLSNGNGLTATYNALGQTTSITSGGTTTNFSYLGEGQNQLSAENTNTLHNDLLGVAWRETCSCTYYFTRTITGQQIDERGPTATYNYLYDGNGSVVALTDSTGHLVNQYAYDPYGNKTTSTGTAPNYFAFQDGYQTTPGLTHYGARYLDPTDAHWTQQDPMQNIGSLTQNDRYAYTGDNPVNLTDPSGLCSFFDCIGNALSGAADWVERAGVSPVADFAEGCIAGAAWGAYYGSFFAVPEAGGVAGCLVGGGTSAATGENAIERVGVEAPER